VAHISGLVAAAVIKYSDTLTEPKSSRFSRYDSKGKEGLVIFVDGLSQSRIAYRCGDREEKTRQLTSDKTTLKQILSNEHVHV
jgi:hypothetical protein